MTMPIISSTPSSSAISNGSHANRIQVDIVIYPKVKSMEVLGPISVLTYANEHLKRRGENHGYDIRLVAPNPGIIESDTLVTFHAQAGLPENDQLATVMIAGARDIEKAVADESKLIDWIRRTGVNAERLVAFCSAGFFLASAGLLTGKRATTHWRVANLLRKQFPAVQVDADAIFINEDNMWTSAGVTAAIDLTLAFVEKDFGRDIALAVAREMVLYLKRPGGQSQFSSLMDGQATGGSGLDAIQSWINDNLDQPIQNSDMALQAGMSERNFARLFKTKLGVSPSTYVTNMRCERAITFLLDTDLPSKTIAFRSGFPSSEQMRKVFVRRFGLTPREYKERFSTAREPNVKFG